jgi:hypothetical protein
MLKEYTIKSSDGKKEYSVVLSFNGKINPEKCSCSCKFGSFYRFTQKNIIAGNWKCIHLIEAIKKYENNEPDNIELEKKNIEFEKKNIKIKPLEKIYGE